MKLQNVILLFLVFLLNAVAYSQVSTEKAQEDLANIIFKESREKAKLTSFEKEDGIKKVKNDISYYSIKFIGEVQFLKNGQIQLMPFLNSAKNSFLDVMDNNGDFYPNGGLFRLVNKDETLNIEGSIQYIKTESSWKAKTILITIKENQK
ncbi:hypothetical protein RCZ04_06620 [Capnocytophaga sp. HP1101]